MKLRSFFPVAVCDSERIDENKFDELLVFFIERLKFYLKDKGLRYDYIDAAVKVGYDDLLSITLKTMELTKFLNSNDGQEILIAYRRAANMLRIEEKKDNKDYNLVPDSKYFLTKQEEALNLCIKNISKKILVSIEAEDFKDSMILLTELRAPINNFFEEVKVNSENVEIRENRLRLLSQIRNVIHNVADLSLIEGQ